MRDNQSVPDFVTGWDSAGMLVNLDQKDKEYAQDGVLTRAGRLECSMQNIADVLSTTSEKRLVTAFLYLLAAPL